VVSAVRVAADRDLCIGAGLCFLTAPAVFDQDDDGLVVLLTAEADGADAEAARTAVGLCPSGAARLVEG
jgi:ferredoxin